MKGIIRIQTEKQFKYYLSIKTCQWESFLEDIKYYKWEITVNNNLHPLLLKNINFNNILQQIYQCQINCGIVLRRLQILSQMQFLQSKTKTQQFLQSLYNYEQFAVKTKKRANQAIEFIQKNQNF